MQAAAPMDTLALLSAPPTPRVSGGKVPSALFHGDLFAYAASSAVMVIDVSTGGNPCIWS